MRVEDDVTIARPLPQLGAPPPLIGSDQPSKQARRPNPLREVAPPQSPPMNLPHGLPPPPAATGHRVNAPLWPGGGEGPAVPIEDAGCDDSQPTQLWVKAQDEVDPDDFTEPVTQAWSRNGDGEPVARSLGRDGASTRDTTARTERAVAHRPPPPPPKRPARTSMFGPARNDYSDEPAQVKGAGVPAIVPAAGVPAIVPAAGVPAVMPPSTMARSQAAGPSSTMSASGLANQGPASIRPVARQGLSDADTDGRIRRGRPNGKHRRAPVVALVSLALAGLAVGIVVARRDITPSEGAPAADLSAAVNVDRHAAAALASAAGVAVAATVNTATTAGGAAMQGQGAAATTGVDPSSLQTAAQRTVSRVASMHQPPHTSTDSRGPERTDSATRGSTDEASRTEPAAKRSARGAHRPGGDDDSSEAQTQESTFDSAAGQKAMSAAAQSAESCAGDDSPEATVRITATFATNGRPTSVSVRGPGYTGTIEAECMASKFRAIQLPEFTGEPVTLSRVIKF